MMDTLIEQFRQNSGFELVAVALAIAYLVLAVREHIACWYAAFISTAIYLVIFFDVRLYMESALQIYYLGMAIFGWYQWRAPRAGAPGLQVTTWPLRRHILALFLIVSASLATAFLLSTYTDARLPLLDSLTTWGAVVTTWMVARKILENWAYWLIIDSLSIYLYLDRGLYFTALLFGVYIVIIGFGWVSWHRRYRAQPATA
jgi:nicotinamide mononucleotide transporter